MRSWGTRSSGPGNGEWIGSGRRGKTPSRTAQLKKWWGQRYPVRPPSGDFWVRSGGVIRVLPGDGRDFGPFGDGRPGVRKLFGRVSSVSSSAGTAECLDGRRVVSTLVAELGMVGFPGLLVQAGP